MGAAADRQRLLVGPERLLALAGVPQGAGKRRQPVGHQGGVRPQGRAGHLHGFTVERDRLAVPAEAGEGEAEVGRHRRSHLGAQPAIPGQGAGLLEERDRRLEPSRA